MNQSRRNPKFAFGAGLMLAVGIMTFNTIILGFTFYPWAKWICGGLFGLGFVLHSLDRVTPIRTFCAVCLSVGGVALAIAVYYLNPLGIQGRVDHTTYLWIHLQLHTIQYMCAFLMLIAGWWLGTVHHETVFGREKDIASVPENSASSVEHEP